MLIVFNLWVKTEAHHVVKVSCVSSHLLGICTDAYLIGLRLVLVS